MDTVAAEAATVVAVAAVVAVVAAAAEATDHVALAALAVHSIANHSSPDQRAQLPFLCGSWAQLHWERLSHQCTQSLPSFHSNQMKPSKP